MDPYKVLGVSRSDSDETIKAAYRKLAKQYHPDKYSGHDLEDLASEKLKQINEAYDLIQKERKAGGSYSRGYGSGYTGNTGSSYGSGYTGSASYAQIRRMIQLGNITQAEAMLDNMENHDAEWHYLKGVILQRKGWYDGARQHFTNARNMQPGNPEYESAFNNMSRNANSYGQQNYGGQYQNSSCSCCDVCAGLMCADCLCNCCGGC